MAREREKGQQRERSVPGIPFAEGNQFRFPAGVSGNPSGRPPSFESTDRYRRVKPKIDAVLLEYWDRACDVKPFAGLGMTWGQVWVRALYVNGIRGRATAITELHERIWGKVALPIKLSTTVELSESSKLLRELTDEELDELSRETSAAAAREEAILNAARQRLGLPPKIIDVEAVPREGSKGGKR